MLTVSQHPQQYYRSSLLVPSQILVFIFVSAGYVLMSAGPLFVNVGRLRCLQTQLLKLLTGASYFIFVFFKWFLTLFLVHSLKKLQFDNSHWKWMFMHLVWSWWFLLSNIIRMQGVDNLFLDVGHPWFGIHISQRGFCPLMRDIRLGPDNIITPFTPIWPRQPLI